MSLKANAVRWAAWHARRDALPPQLPPQPLAETPQDDPIVLKLKRALEEKVDALLKCKDPKECAQLALAIRAVRETYHLVTGEARPGVRRDGRRRGPSGNAAWREASVAQQPQPPAADKPSL